jgi:outer membrane protein assembly factor BamE (lipoprotein component of BamABCDE complex)|tara:strand:- start:756 stop:1241 length:486 start_codon:yes stop_codon:yes gene_type:complete
MFVFKKIHKITIFSLFLLLSDCQVKPVSNTHGVAFLEEKEKKIIINKSNKNDVVQVLGPPVVTGTFDDTIWIFIERVQTKGKIFKFGRNVTSVNNALIVKFDDYGLVAKKEFYDITKNKKIKFSKNTSSTNTQENDFIYSFLSSLRQKINNPLNKKIVPRN